MSIQKEFERVLALAKAEQMTLTDFIGEFQKLLRNTGDLEKVVKELNNIVSERDKSLREMQAKWEKAEAALIPQDELERRRFDLELAQRNHEQNVFAFNCHKDYLVRENGMVREILSSLLARKEINEKFFIDYISPPGYTDANGRWITPCPVPEQRHEKTEEVYKPNLPNPTLK